MAGGNGARGEPLLRVLRVSHSSVVTGWRQREHWLRQSGLDVELLTAHKWSEGGTEVPLRAAPGEPVTGVRTVGRHPCGFFYAPSGLWRALRSAGYDLVDLQEEPYSLAALQVVVTRWLARRAGPTVFYSAQNLPKRHPWPVRMAEQVVLRASQGAYPCNEAAAANLRRKGFAGIVRVVPLGVDPPALPGTALPGTALPGAALPGTALPGGAPAAVRPPSGGEWALRVGYAGRLVTEKGVHVALEAVLGEPSWALGLAGEGPERERLADRVERAGAGDRVELLGHCEGPSLAAFYRSIDVLVVPSLPTSGWEEQFGRVAVEAMAHGAPVVSSTSGSLPEVIGDAGLLVPPGDAAALHAALAGLQHDPGQRAALAAKGLRRARAYSWEAVARQQAALYRAVASGAAGERAGTGQELPGPEVVIVAYGKPELLARALAGLGRGYGGLGLPVTVVDNSSRPEVEKLAFAHGAKYMRPGGNVGFAAAVNLAIGDGHVGDRHVGPGRDVLLLNPDAEVDPGTVRALQRRLHAESRLACVAPAQVDAAGVEQRVAWPWPTPARYWLQALGLGRLLRRQEFLVGSVLMLNGEALREVGAFDEAFFLYGEETDWQRRARGAGWGA
ncbi:MAG: glycosyltransferase, partial [Acidimicrobiales bacterium]